MAYFSPYIDETGMNIPAFEDIRDDLIASMKQIFGQDIYIDEDSMDYQQISIFARKIYDTNSLALLVYNNRTPNTAIGASLDNLCALVGITRKPATFSTVQLTITGDPNTVINNGKAFDGTNTWLLPDTVTIPSNGIITVECQCEVAGNITAASNTITQIMTPTYGWLSVTNNYSAVPGSDIESDTELRGRFAKSTELPSSTVIDGITAAIESVEGVTRVAAYENDTNSTSSEGFPAHSITYVVEGGSNAEVGEQIYYKKTPGCYTNGTTSVQIASSYGLPATIRFYRPTYKNIYVNIALTKLPTFTDSYLDDIKDAIVKYINDLQISDDVYTNMIMAVALGQMGQITSPAYSITSVQLSTDGTTYSSSDVSCAFNEAATISRENINITAT